MSKLIRLTEPFLEEIRRDFEEALKKADPGDDKFNFTKQYPSDDRKATIFFTADAWTKMVMLIKEFGTEVAWHGVAHRSDREEQNAYYISDILVYPQEVSAAKVDMDDHGYAVWLQDNDEDERFKALRMQGHSHVNFGVTPSSTDMGHQWDIVKMLGEEDFYIFMIWNKSLDSNCWIYDMKKNALFENKDITIEVVGKTEIMRDFLKNAKDMVKEKNVCPSYRTPTYQGRHGGERHTYDQDEQKPPFNGVSQKPYNPIQKTEQKPRTQYGGDGDWPHPAIYPID